MTGGRHWFLATYCAMGNAMHTIKLHEWTTLILHVCNAEPLDDKIKQMYTFQAMQVSPCDASNLRT